MATRSLTDAYMRIRENFVINRRLRDVDHRREAKATLFNRSLEDEDLESGRVEEGGSAPEWVAVIDSVKSDMRVIKDKIADLAVAHDHHIRDVFGKNEEYNEEAIEIRTQEVKRLFERCEVKIKKVGQGQQKILDGQQVGELKKLSTDELVRRNVMVSLITDLKNLGNDFRKGQRVYLQKLKLQKDRTAQIAGHLDSPSASRGLEREDGVYDPGFSETQLDSVALQDDMILERDNEIRSILQSITDLQDMFRDLSSLVVEQGTILDRIDYNIEQVVLSTEEAVGELQQAHKYQKRSLLSSCIMFLIVAIVIVIIALFIKS